MPDELPLRLRHPLPVLLRHHGVDPARALLPGIAVAAVGPALLPAVALFPALAAIVGALLPAVVVITLLPAVLAVSVIIITFFCHAAIITISVTRPAVWAVRVATVLAISVIIIAFFSHAAIIANSVAWPVVWTVRVALLKT